MRTFSALLLIVVCGVPAMGQATSTVAVSAPLLGHFFERSRGQLHPLTGIPGSGFAGDPIDERKWDLVEFSPAQDYALAMHPDSGLVRITFPDAGPTTLPVAGALATISGIAISPTGSSALIYSESARKAQIVRGTGAVQDLDWPAMPGKVTAMAIDDAGDLVFVAAQDGLTTLYSVSGAGAPQMVYQAAAISSVSFLRNSREAVVAAPADHQVIRIRDNAGVASPMILADQRNGIGVPSAVAVSESGANAFVLDESGDVLAIPLTGEAPSRISCFCTATQLQRMRGRDLFLLNSDLGSDLFVLDASGGAMQVLRMSAEPRRAPAQAGDSRQ